MARKARVEFAGAVYHLLDRGKRPGVAGKGLASYLYKLDSLPVVLDGAEVDYAYDRANRMTTLDLKRSDGQNTYLMLHDTYTVDDMNRLTGLARSGYSDSYTYDTAGELKSASYGAAYTAAARTVTYTWDNAGNRKNVTETDLAAKTYTANAMNQYTTAEGLGIGYGSMNEIAGFKGKFYKYYGDTYLSSVSAGTGGDAYQYIYDALGRMVERRLNGVAQYYYLFDGEHWVVEYYGGGAVKSTTICGLGIDEVVARAVAGGGQWPLPDRNGNTILMTGPIASNGFASILEKYRYDAFGQPTVVDAGGTVLTSSAIGNKFLFTGREWNNQFGFYEYRARAYHPGLGRFMSEDPKGFDAGDYNLYRYCHNDPWDLSDPMGKYAEGFVNDNLVEINVPIRYYGPGATAATVAAFNSNIEKAWSGNIGIYQVHTRVTTPSANTPASKMNSIYVPLHNTVNGKKVAFVNDDARTGVWPADFVDAVKHEVGHLMHLFHSNVNPRSNDSNPKTNPPSSGRQNDVMNANGSSGTVVTPANLEEVIWKNMILGGTPRSDIPDLPIFHPRSNQ